MEFSHRLLAFLQRNLSAVCRPIQSVVSALEYWLLEAWWALRGCRKPSAEDIAYVAENVTIMFKSFERQKQARALVKSIWKYYPRVRIVIADDSATPLTVPDYPQGSNLKIIQMPFNSGLSKSSLYLIKLFRGKAKEVPVLMYILSAIFALMYVLSGI